jgi:hypothetical protein
VLTNWQSLVACLSAEITEGLPQVEIQDLATLTACCVESAVAAQSHAGTNVNAASGMLATSVSDRALYCCMDTCMRVNVEYRKF